MNKYLIKKYRINIIRLLSLIVISTIFLVYSCEVNIFTVTLLDIVILYSTFNIQGILLEIRYNENKVLLMSYSIIRGKKEFELELDKIIDVDYDGNFILTYKDDYGKDIEKYELNAEPWNNLYSQIKQLKLNIQERENLD